MEMINRAFLRALSMHVVVCILLASAVVLCIWASRKKDSMTIYAVVIGIFLIIYSITSLIPLAKDYLTQDVIQVDATYVNAVGNQSKSTSSILGEYSVVLETEEGEIALTTVPFSREVFPAGEYIVTAWYAKNSKRLLYIDIHNVVE